MQFIFYNNNKEEAEKILGQVYELLAEILLVRENNDNETLLT